MKLFHPITPAEVPRQVSDAIPFACRGDIIIVGSLTAGYHYLGDDPRRGIRTKDVDALFAPHRTAVASSHRVTEELIRADWVMREAEHFDRPGSAGDPVERLPMVRLQPQPGNPWFLELLGAPEAGATGTTTERLETSHGHFALRSFGFLGLAEFEPLATPLGLRIARPEMMALANLLHHPAIGDQTIGDTDDKRSNKDLGRVIALSFLQQESQRHGGWTRARDEWPSTMWRALRDRYPNQAGALAQRAGHGLRALLASPDDLRQAHDIARRGLLDSVTVSESGWAAQARRLLQDVLEELRRLAAA